MATLTLEEQAADDQVSPRAAAFDAHSNRHLPVGQSVLRGALALLSTQPLTWGASLVTAVALPRLLGAETLGHLTLALTISALASTVAGLGVSEFLVRRVAQGPEALRRDASIAFSVQMVTATLAAIAVALGGLFLPNSFVDYPLLLVAVIPIFVAPAQTVLLSSFRGTERHKQYAWFSAAGVVVVAASGVLVLVAGGTAVASAAVSGSFLALTTVVAWKLFGPRLDVSFRRSALPAFAEFIRGGLPFLAWQLILLSLGDLDRVLMRTFVPAAEIGWYAAAGRIIGFVVFIPTLVLTPLFPALSRSVDDNQAIRRTITQALRLLIFLMIGLAAGTIVVAPAVPALFGWPADFAGAIPPMMILALHEPMVAIDMVLGALLMAIHRERRWVVVGIAAATFKVCANVILVPHFEAIAGNGTIGGATSTVLTETFMLVGALIVIPKQLLDIGVAWYALRIVLAGILATVSGLALLQISVFVSAPAAAVVYVAAVMLLRAVGPADLHRLGGLVLGAARRTSVN